MGISITPGRQHIQGQRCQSDSLLWGVRYDSADIGEFHHIYVDANDSIYLFGNEGTGYEHGKIMSVGKDAGVRHWTTETPNLPCLSYDVDFREMVDQDGYLHILWRHNNFGGLTCFGVMTCKVDKLTGNLDWFSKFNFNGVGAGPVNGTGIDGGMSLDLDDQGNVYVTGYYGTSNYGPEAWGIVKLDGNNGADIYDITMTEDSARYDEISWGLATYVIRNKPYFIGELQTTRNDVDLKSKVTLFKIEPNSGSVLLKKYLNGAYQFPSRTIQIERQGTGKTAVLKQVGRSVELELYDYNNNLLWQRSFLKNYLLKAGTMKIDGFGNIVFSATSHREEDQPPYYEEEADSIHFYSVSATGNLQYEYDELLGDGDTRLSDIVIGSSGRTFFFYRQFERVAGLRLSVNGISPEFPTLLEDKVSIGKTTHFTDYSSTHLLGFGYKFSDCKMIAINKNSLSTSELATIPRIKEVQHVLRAGATVVYIGGVGFNGEDVLVSFDLTQLDTNWTRSYTSQGEIYKMVLNSTGSELYTVGVEGTDVVARKVSTQTGSQIWAYNYGGQLGMLDEPADLALDQSRNQLTFTGYQTDPSQWGATENVFIETVTTGGAHVRSIVMVGDTIGEHRGLCSTVLWNGSVWVGGNVYTIPDGKAGFINETDQTLTDIDDPNSGELEASVKLFPNPCKESVTVQCLISEPNSYLKIELIAPDGKQLYSFEHERSRKGIYEHLLPAPELAGIFLARIQINDQVITKKIIHER